MVLRIVEESVESLEHYGRVPIAFGVESAFKIEPVGGGLGGILLSEEKVEHPYIKDYDREDGEGPVRWLKRWDISRWGFLSAYADGRRIGGAVAANDTEGVHMLMGRRELAALWDIRVHPEFRRQGVGSKLFRRAVQWARARGCTSIIAETQNINVPACRFYAWQGCLLSAFSTCAYAGLPDEVMLIWKLDI